jgi:hypothetical protein
MVLAAAAAAGWFTIWGYYAAVESRWAETYWWTDYPNRIWINIALWLLAPVVLGSVARAFTAGRVSLAGASLVAAAPIALYTAQHEALPLEYDNGMKLVYPVYTHMALSVLGMGMLVPVALRWLAMLGVGQGRTSG